jgi:tetratricopeptide (TPR) repeat protein
MPGLQGRTAKGRRRVLVTVIAVSTSLASSGAQTPAQPSSPSGTTAWTAPSSPLTPAWRAFYAGDLDKAAALARAALKANARDTGARLVLVRVAIERGDAEAAYAELRRAQRQVPDDPDVLYYLALVAGDLARTAFDGLYALAPESARVHQLMAESFEAQDKKAEAEAEYEAALRADPMLLDALLGLAKLKRTRLACPEAIALYERAEAVRPTFDGAFGLGACLAIEGLDEQAIAAFTRALARDEQGALAWVGLGSAYTRVGRLTEAIAALQRAASIEPRMSDAYYALGQAYRKAGDSEQARAAFDKARELRSAEPLR